ncbi:Alpha/Beta hydrolase protein [Hypoxylon rubiginosum]|uniref:Alpha/Beta hydrolase protein n=1 Tax=Hypoxylon rubiginosum TaxID=110542 RepID=A0ACB9YSH1_9PEZI|nr:Alpha/Beta hydrolase protein [Hypoxylon rubiginosum]
MSLTLFRATWLTLAIGCVVAAEPIVKFEGSKVTYHGTTQGPVEHFQNIKFAHDTSGERRFSPPELYTPVEGSEIDATAPGSACPQSKAGIPPFFDETPDISEDCLNLRIARPAGTTAEDNLPVVIWLHGGGVVKGTAYDPHFDPDNLITLSTSLQKPIIYVALNYRLTIFGFARLPILNSQKSLNVGMRDQRAGFQWVKDNIKAFGGDPKRVTVFGLSSGGTFISLHPMAYGGERGVPFTQAWAMSGPPGTALNITSDATEIHTLAVAKKLECGGRDGEILKCLREVPMEKLTETAMEYSVNNHPPAGLFTFIPSVDGDFIPDRQSVLSKTGKFVKGIPMVFGWAQDDGATNAGLAPTFQKEDDMKAPIKGFAHALTDADYEELFSHYPASDFEEEVESYESRRGESDPVAPVHYFRVSRILRDILFTCSSVQFGYEMSRQSKALDVNYPGVRLYDLNQSMLTPMLKAAGMPYIGVCHGSDTNYIFNGLFPEGRVTEADQRLSESIAGSFINFAATGTPIFIQNGDLIPWPESFPSVDERSMSGPSELNIQLIGGPLGTGFCSLARKYDDATNFASREGSMQIPLMDGIEVGEMESLGFRSRQRELEREKLLERCTYISTLSEKLGV